MHKPFYPNLFKPMTVNGVTFKNRIFSAPNMINQIVKGAPTQYFIGYLEHKARGGACQVTAGENPVDDRGAHTKHIELCSENIPLLAEAAAAIKEHGAVASAELTHAGADGNPRFNSRPLIGPVSFTRADGVRITAMTEADMDEVAEAFADAAAYFKLAGFDMVMVHSGHNWLLSQFLSPLTNTRTDKYGGSVENRMRFPLMVLQRVRARVGPDFPVELRVSGSDRSKGGKEVGETIELLKAAQEGLIDMVQVSSGMTPESAIHAITSTFMEKCHNVDLSAAIKAAGIKIPVITVGAVMDPASAEKILADGLADGVAMARALIADPYLPEKARLGRPGEIRPCLRCINCSTSDDPVKQHMICSVNPLIGREGRLGFERPQPAKRRKVLVIGGGPAGMQAAISAAEQGHDVTLAEKDNALGGLLRFTDTDSLKEDLRLFKEYLIRRIDKLQINVLLNTSADEKLIETVKPDSVIIAVGSAPIIPAIPGADSARHAIEAYRDPESIGNRVIIIGGGLVGIETALHLSNIGKNVTVIEMTDTYAADSNEMHKLALDYMIEKLHVTVLKDALCTGIKHGAVTVQKDGMGILLEADTILYAVGMKARTDVYLKLWDQAPMVRHIGDCKKVGKVDGAIHTGYFAALDI